MGVRRQGLEPRTVALREPAGRFLDLRRPGHIGSDLGVCLPLLSVADPWSPMVRGPSAAQKRARRTSRCDLFRVREPGRVAATCDVCLGLVGELGG